MRASSHGENCDLKHVELCMKSVGSNNSFGSAVKYTGGDTSYLGSWLLLCELFIL